MIPYTVVVLLLGCVYGLIVRTNCARLSWFTLITDTKAEVFLLIFLPVLIYESAFTMQIYLFQKLLLHMLIVGSVGMGKKFVFYDYHTRLHSRNDVTAISCFINAHPDIMRG